VKDLVSKEVVEKCGEYVCMLICINTQWILVGTANENKTVRI